MLPKAVAPGMDVDMPDVLGLPTGKGAGASQTDLYSRMKALQKHLQFLDIQEEYIKDEMSNLKRELVRRRCWSNRLELRTALFEYIEVFYNRRRLHSSIGYKTPAEVEQAYDLARAA